MREREGERAAISRNNCEENNKISLSLSFFYLPNLSFLFLLRAPSELLIGSISFPDIGGRKEKERLTTRVCRPSISSIGTVSLDSRYLSITPARSPNASHHRFNANVVVEPSVPAGRKHVHPAFNIHEARVFLGSPRFALNRRRRWRRRRRRWRWREFNLIYICQRPNGVIPRHPGIYETTQPGRFISASEQPQARGRSSWTGNGVNFRAAAESL